MDLTRLASFLKQPEVHRRILGNYSGAYSIGITFHPDNEKEAAIRVCVEGDDATLIATHITLAGQKFPVIVNTQFIAPRPLVNIS